MTQLSADSKARVLDELSFMFATGNLRPPDSEQEYEEVVDGESDQGEWKIGDRVYWHEEFTEDTLEYARTKLAGNTKQQKTCKRGFSCGFACVSKTKSCRSPLPGQAANYADWLVLQIARGGPFSTTHTKEAKNRGLIQPPQPSRKTTQFAQQWSSAFDNAPDDLKSAIARFDEPDENILPTETAYYTRGKNTINMDGYSKGDTSLSSSAVYRHEYGHHLDSSIGKANLLKSAAELAPESNIRTIADFDKLTLPAKKALAKKLKPQLGYDVAMYGVRNVSNSPLGRAATDADAQYLIGKKKLLESDYVEAYDTLSAAYKKDPASRMYDINDISDPSIDQKAALGRKMQIAEIDKELQGSVKYPKNVDFQTKRNLMRQHYDDTVRAEIKDKPEVYRLLYEEKIKSDSSPILFGSRLILAARKDDPQLLADEADKLFDSVNTNDLIGSITLNAVGRGHSTEYYSRNGDLYDAKGTEAFANLTDLHGQNTPLSKALAEHLAPNTYKFFKEALRGD